jgi:hypothetical protein
VGGVLAVLGVVLILAPYIIVLYGMADGLTVSVVMGVLLMAAAAIAKEFAP